MPHVNETVINYLAAWNARDAKQRRALVAKAWTDGGSYVDAHRQGTGHDAIDAMIAKVQDRLPGYVLNLSSGVEAFPGHVRFSWATDVSTDAPLFIAGTDFATLAADGRFEKVTGFTDAAPAPMPA